jgi:L-2-hydroxyglutarate oxidase
MRNSAEIAVVGGGLIGLATARAIFRKRPSTQLVILEKESRVALHQSGQNSGVLHTGAFYAPGSLKARFCSLGRTILLDYVREARLPFEVTGKLVVAGDPEGLDRLGEIERWGRANGVPSIERLDSAKVRDREPAVRALGGLWLPSAAIVDFGGVARRIATDLARSGVEIQTRTRFERARVGPERIEVSTNRGSFAAQFLVNCAGLQSDRVAWASGVTPGVRIFPFRGEYYELVGRSRGLVRGLVYPVPPRSLPFLGIHLTRQLDGRMVAGPNVVFSLAREGYRPHAVNLRDLVATVSSPGFVPFLRRYSGLGRPEFRPRKRVLEFGTTLRSFVPELDIRDLRPSRAGIRAQAVADDGRLVDDFVLHESPRSFHVLNAPSPAASSAFALGEAIADRVLARLAPA